LISAGEGEAINTGAEGQERWIPACQGGGRTAPRKGWIRGIRRTGRFRPQRARNGGNKSFRLQTRKGVAKLVKGEPAKKVGGGETKKKIFRPGEGGGPTPENRRRSYWKKYKKGRPAKKGRMQGKEGEKDRRKRPGSPKIT